LGIATFLKVVGRFDLCAGPRTDRECPVQLHGRCYLNKRNTALAPAFTTVDAGLAYRTGRAELRLDGRNLGNRRDAVAESEFGDAQYYRMTARTIQAGVVMRY